MLTEKDLSVEQNMAIKLAIDCMERNINRYFNRRIMNNTGISVGFGQAINILTEMITIKEQK